MPVLVLACVKAAPLAEVLGAKGIAAAHSTPPLVLQPIFCRSPGRSPARSLRDELAHVPDLHLFLVRRVLTFTNQFPRPRTLLSSLITIPLQGPIHRCCGTWMLAQRTNS
ncbi:hypothetical protein BS47DRAFT_1351658 [Hydnum rufescens UP504]|uniref:Uncharacterized protein n=1 Tax=Hydnum rufescens UP504 TaxID=1448309 RepID=A0A9P6AKE2_9AGAM|nr:hypothetical protein BS47DRAFT_1351658 [Hydnum rufescens UP504]